MKNLFYSEKGGSLFWVAGYTHDGNTANVVEKIKSLKKNAETFAEIAGVEFEAVKTHYVEKSQRYKYMRVFYVELPAEKVPDEAFQLGADWSMWQWLEN